MESFIRTMIFYPHFEIVDVLNILSIIKHYAKDFDITLVVIKFNLENIKLLLLDIPNIKFYVLDDIKYYQANKESFDYLNKMYDEVKMIGLHKDPNYNLVAYPKCFYTELAFDFSIYNNYTIKMNNINNNFYMLKNLKNHNKQFIFLSLINTTYKHTINLKTNKIIICPDENMYDLKHEYYEIAKLFVQQPILDYISVIEEASEIHVIDNLFYYLTLKCNLNSDNNTCYSTEYNGLPKRPVLMDNRFKYEIINEPYVDLDLIRKQTLMHMRDRKN